MYLEKNGCVCVFVCAWDCFACCISSSGQRAIGLKWNHWKRWEHLWASGIFNRIFYLDARKYFQRFHLIYKDFKYLSEQDIFLYNEIQYKSL